MTPTTHEPDLGPDDGPAATNRYRVFGRWLETELAFPELVPEGASENGEVTGGGEAADGAAAGRARGGVGDDPPWTLEIREGPAEPPDGPLLGEDTVEEGVKVRLHRDGTGLRLVYEDTGEFRVSDDGASVAWWPPGGSVEEGDARLDVLGRVLPLALHQAGLLTLHASAVETADGAVGFLGAKGAGKSTLALRLCRSGARLLTDDALPVDAGPPARALPGVPRLRVREDVAEAEGLAELGNGAVRDGRRVVAPEAGAADAAPLSALYLLSPVPPEREDDAGVRSERLRGPRAVLAVMGQLKLGPILDGWAADELLSRCVRLVEGVAVHRLEVPRDLGRLDDVEGFLRERHGDLPVESPAVD